MRDENIPLTSIRGVVALWVVAHHLALRFIDTGLMTPDRFLSPGGAGVDIFFILSGLVMAAVHGDVHPGAAGPYLARRVFRIWPLHLAVMAALVGVALLRLWAGRPSPTENWARLPEAILLLQPFTGEPLAWNVASWSLGVEMACYLAFPFAAPLLAGLSPAGAAAAALLLGTAEYLVLQEIGPVVTGPGAAARGFAGFGFGAAMGFALKGRRLAGFWLNAGQIAAVAAIGAALWLGRPQLTPMFAAALIALLFVGRGVAGRALEAPPLHWAGRISYSVYLIHLPVIGVAALLAPPQAVPGPWGLAVWSLAVIAVVLGLSHVSWRLVEEPCRRYGARFAAGLRAGRPAPA
ncbi:acyltransferase family protein [Camelimonas abortus]|uniref:acyltransferase family protein n=1 Tax=Camelimonas abortus TaxID=1017184 RepID=UPI0035F04449